MDSLRAERATEITSASSPSERRLFVELASTGGVVPCVRILRGKADARLMAITCVDLPAHRELLYHYSLGRDVLSLRARLQKPEAATASIAPIDAAAELMEHEVTEFFGVAFEGNPRKANMILPDGYTERPNPLSRRAGSLELRIGRNLANIVSTGATTSQSKRVAKARTGLGLAENPPLCGVACPGSCAAQDISDSCGTSSRHPGLKKGKGAGE